MAVNIYLKRSSTASKRPASTALAAGELALNYDANTSGLYFCDTAGGIVKVGPAEVSTTAPNATPAGSTGNSKGEFWFNPSGCGALQIWDGTAWRNIPPQSTPLSLGTIHGCTSLILQCGTFLGGYAGCVSTGQENVAVGHSALRNNTIGQENVAVGAQALGLTTNTSYNVAIGRSSLCNTTAGDNIGVGRNTLANSQSGGQVAIGSRTLENLTTGQANIVIGRCGAIFSTTASYNVGIGHDVLFSQTTSQGNTAVGYRAMVTHTAAADFNTALGSQAGEGLTGSRNTGVGACAIRNVSGACNVGIGANAAQSVSGSFNVGIGANAAQNVSGADNVAVGSCALCTLAVMSGINNVAIGARAARALTTGACNTIVGFNAAAGLTTGVCNIMIGQSAGSIMAAGNNNIVIGTQSHAIAPAINLDGMVIIGHNQNINYITGNQVSITNGAGGRATFAGATPTAWTFASDGRLKDNVEDLALGLDYVKKIRPVSYTWKECEANNESAWGVKAAGFIAQDLLALEEECDARFINSVNTDNPDCYMVGKESLIPVLVKAIQDLAAEVEGLKSQLSAQG